MGRGARVGVGLAVVAVLLLSTVILVATGFSGLDWSDGLTAQAQAQVLDVDHDEWDDTWVSVDVQFEYEGEVEVTYIDWPSGKDDPRLGSQVPVRFDPFDPEYTVVYDDDPGNVDQHAGDPAAPTFGRLAWAWWAAAGCVLAALLVVVATVVWALRAPKKPRPVYAAPYPAPYPVYPPPPGWGAPPSAWVPAPPGPPVQSPPPGAPPSGPGYHPPT